MTENRAAGLYALAFLPTGVAAVALSGWLMDLTTHQSSRAPSGVSELAANIVPAFVVGLLAYFALARFVSARLSDGRTFATHARRCAALYLVAVVLGAVLVHDARSQDFWSFGQLVLWPWLTAVAGVVADAVTMLQPRRENTNGA